MYLPYIPCTLDIIDIYVSSRQLCGNSMKCRPKCAVVLSAAFVTRLQQPTSRDRTLPVVVTTRPAVIGYNGGTRRSGAVNQDHHHNDDDHDDHHDDDDRTSMLPNVTTSIKTTTTTTNNNNKNRIDDTEFDWDTFLDTPFFDPHRILQDPNSDERWKRFATWVQEDYETVEVIFTATLFIVLIVVTQELLRIQIYGLEHYVPFGQGTRPGSLF